MDWKLGPPRRRIINSLPAAPTLPPTVRRVYPFKNVDEALKRAVWNKGIIIEGYDPDGIRRDSMGSIMLYHQHGECSEFGWEIDHIIPRAANGSSDLFNLQPLQWKNNRRKGDITMPIRRPQWSEYLHGR